MCEMLGISAKRRIRANDILREFYSHADRHPHGWGLATFNDAGAPDIEKEAVKATESEYLKKRLAEPIEESVLLAHIRLATVGHLEYRNSHPFAAADNCGRIWTLEHNGTIFNGAELNRYMGLQFGSTDSERILLHLVDIVNERQIRHGRALDWKERFAALDDLQQAEPPRLRRGNTLRAYELPRLAACPRRRRCARLLDETAFRRRLGTASAHASCRCEGRQNRPRRRRA